MSKQLYSVTQKNSVLKMQKDNRKHTFSVKVSLSLIQCRHHPAQFSSNGICASRSIVNRNGGKRFLQSMGETRLSWGGQFSSAFKKKNTQKNTLSIFSVGADVGATGLDLDWIQVIAVTI